MYADISRDLNRVTPEKNTGAEGVPPSGSAYMLYLISTVLCQFLAEHILGRFELQPQ
jgi:hypothetical protein